MLAFARNVNYLLRFVFHMECRPFIGEGYLNVLEELLSCLLI